MSQSLEARATVVNVCLGCLGLVQYALRHTAVLFCAVAESCNLGSVDLLIAWPLYAVVVEDIKQCLQFLVHNRADTVM